MKKMIALTLGFLLLGAFFAVAQDQVKEPKKAQNKTALKNKGEAETPIQNRFQYKYQWMDQDGDGICDGDGNMYQYKYTYKHANAGEEKGPFSYKHANANKTGDDETAALAAEGAADQAKLRKNLKEMETAPVNDKGQQLRVFGKGSFRRGLTTPGQVTGAGVPAQGAAVKTATQNQHKGGNGKG